MSQKKYLLWVILFSLALSFAFSQSEVSMYISRLQSGDPLLVQDAQYNILIQCYAYNGLQKLYATGIINIIQQEDNIPDTVIDHQKVARQVAISVQRLKQKTQESIVLSDAKTSAILLAGNLRMKEALPVLAKHLNYVTPGHFSNFLNLDDPRIDYFPCAISMTMMGDTAIPYLLDIAKHHPDQMTRFLAGRTIKTIREYKDIKPLDDALKQSTDSTEQSNLKDVINFMKNIKG